MHVAAVQQAREDACVRTAAEADAKCVVLCDRGIVDGAAFTNRVEWEHVLSSVEMTHQQALARYDAALFLHTPEDAYTLDNNDARRESAADALKRDQQTLDAWRSHSHVKEIFGNQDFTKKMDDVVDHALSFLGEIPRVGRARTLLVRRPDIAQLTRQTRCTNVYVRTTFATTPDGVTHALVRSETDEEVLYEVRANGVRHRIGFAEYHALSAFADPNFKPVEETRLYFALAQGQNGQAALLEELRFYPFFPYQALLRAPEHADGKPAVPAFIQTIRDVSDNEVYTVRGFARALAQGRL